MLTRELLQRLPKAELHTHLDSALRAETMVELAREAKFALPTSDPDALRRFMLVDDAGSLEDYLARFEYTIPLLQTPEGIERVRDSGLAATLVTATIDERLNEDAFIVPGLGDAGDRLFGPR